MNTEPETPLREDEPTDVARILVANHRRFLAFLEHRVGQRDAAREILQDAFVRGLAHRDTVRDSESVVAWFYRVLRNTLIDHHRRQGARERALAGAQHEPTLADDPEAMAEVCKCVLALVDTLKPAYGEAVRQVDLEGKRVQDYAASVGITANSAGVRLHRARAALHGQLARSCGACAEHGCLDCTCAPGTSSC